MMTLLDEKYKLNIYGFEQQPTEYQHDLMNMIRNLNLEKRVRCKKKSTTTTLEKAFLENDICINLSATFEETLGNNIRGMLLGENSNCKRMEWFSRYITGQSNSKYLLECSRMVLRKSHRFKREDNGNKRNK